jgi:hypothetical protein
MRSALAMAFLVACSPTSDSDSRSPFVSGGHDDSGSNDDTADWRSHRVPGRKYNNGVYEVINVDD